MTGLLTDMMRERADGLDAPEIDLATITRDGDRRTRRRRTTLAGGLAVAAAVTALAVPMTLSGGDAGPPGVADGTTLLPQPLSWITGSRLHRPGVADVDLGVDVRAWVWVGDDIVLTDAQHQVHLWSDGRLSVVDSTAVPEPDDAELVADGDFAAWVDADGRAVRYEVPSQELVVAPAFPGRDARVTAVDGAQVYVADSAGTYAWQPADPGSYQTFMQGRRGAVLDAEDGVTVSQLGDTRRAVVDRNGRELRVTTDGFANLAPGGGLVSVEGDDVGRVFDTVTGDLVGMVHGHEWAIGYQWLDPTTLAVMAYDGLEAPDADQSAWLLTCDGSTGACDGPGVEVPHRFGEFQLPVGIHFED